MPNLTNSQEPEPLEKKYQEPEPLGKKIRSRSRLKKTSGAGAAKKFAGSPALFKIKELRNFFKSIIRMRQFDHM